MTKKEYNQSLNGINGKTHKCSYCGVRGDFTPYFRGERVCVPCQDACRLADQPSFLEGLESDEVTSGRDDKWSSDERLLYCNTCGDGHPSKDMGLVYGQYCCINCADGMGEKLQMRGMPQ